MPDEPPTGDVTRWLSALNNGDGGAVDRLVPLLYTELRVMAKGRMRKERAAHTLGTTGLVNEVYLRFKKQDRIQASDRAQFLAAASNTMRRVLVDYGRAKKSQKRGSGEPLIPLDAVEPFLPDDEIEDLLLLDEALSRLEAINPEGALVVQHRFFSGLTQHETAEVLGLSSKTVRRRWFAARAWLRKEMSSTPGADQSPRS